MANRAQLFNTEILSSDPSELERARLSAGASYVQIGEAANRIPVPWLTCFRSSDLRPVELKLRMGPAEFETIALKLPCTTLVSARNKLQASLPIFEAILGSADLAQAYGQHALQGLDKLPFDYLTFNPLEVLMLNDWYEEARALEACLTGQLSELPLLKQLAFFEEGFAPYPLEQYLGIAPAALDHQARLGNSAAFDPGYLSPECWTWHRPEFAKASGSQPGRPWWRFWA